MNKNEDINELLARYFAHEPLTLVQQRALDEWISANGQEFERMRKLMEIPVKVSKEIHFDAEKAWQKIEPRLQERPKTVAFRRKMTFIWSAAASLLLLLGIGAFYLSVQVRKNSSSVMRIQARRNNGCFCPTARK